MKISNSTKILFGCGLLVIVGWFAFSGRFMASKYFSDKADENMILGNYKRDRAKILYVLSKLFDGSKAYSGYQLAGIYLMDQEYDLALKYINKEIERDGGVPNFRYLRGLISGYQGNFGQAEDDFRFFLENNKKDNTWAGYLDLSWIYLREEKNNEAIGLLIDGREVYPENPLLAANLGLAYYKAGNYQLAEETLKEAKQMMENFNDQDVIRSYPGNNPNRAAKLLVELKLAVRYNLMLTYQKSGKTTEYVREYYEYIDSLPKGDERRTSIDINNLISQ